MRQTVREREAMVAVTDEVVDEVVAAVVGRVGSSESSCFFQGNHRLSGRHVVISFHAENAPGIWVRTI